MNKLLLALLALVAVLTACAPEPTETPEPPTTANGFEFDLYSDGVTEDGTVWTKVTWISGVRSSDSYAFYTVVISDTNKVHIEFDPMVGDDIFFADLELQVGTALPLNDYFGGYYGELLLEEDGTVTWTAPSDGNYVPGAEPTQQQVPPGPIG